MRSTGEVMGIASNFPEAFLKAQLATGMGVPDSGDVFLSVRDADKNSVCELARRLADVGFKITATSGTADSLERTGIACRRVNKVTDGRPHCVDSIRNGEFVMVVNTTEGAAAIRDSQSLRRQTLHSGVPYFTTIAAATAAVGAIETRLESGMEVRALQDYHADQPRRPASMRPPAQN